ncbi:unnamed protein product [Enterobius vermicularis]|uniref:LRRCT domain-containing protein n=1 Tax=Enterobius vermicularis TaxID=51028 RepID=A0A0N4UZA6_ENTVE|nr:unnamed protein product [Enterobius vermicularis]
MEKLRIEQLTIVDASWPLLKQITRITVRSLRLIRCGITEIEADAFLPIADILEKLVIVNNSLVNLATLGSLPKLQLLNLDYNKLNVLSKDVFKRLGKLKHLRLEGNMLSELPRQHETSAISRDLLKDVGETLELLDLSNNALTTVPSDALSTTKNLRYLDLSYNKISTLRKIDLRHMDKLIEIRLNDNALTSIGDGAFDELTQLQYLYLQRNGLTNFDSSRLLDGLKKLEVLDLSCNNLEKVPHLHNHPNVRQVKFDSNKIRVLRSSTFKNNPRLQLLSLQNNRIDSLADGTFHELKQLTILLLENNLIHRLMLRGAPRLQQLNLRNNSLNELENNTFQFVPELKIIDLSYNGLHRIPRNLFVPLRSVVWLDLSFNALSSFEEGTFNSRIPHIILVGNPLECDAKIDWFVAYLIKNQVRTQLPLHPYVTCTSPKKYVGVRLQDLITKKAEDTLNAVGNSFNPKPARSQQDFLSKLLPSTLGRLIPGFTPPPPPNPVADVPVIGGIAEAVPALRNIPGLSLIPKPEDQMVKAMPKLAIPPKIDFTQLPPDTVARAYRGEPIPGIPKEATELGLKNHVIKVHQSAAAMLRGDSPLNNPTHLYVLNSVPPEIIADVTKGSKLPHLSDEQMKVVKDYFDMKLPSTRSSATEIEAIDFSPDILKLVKFLPPNYDLNKIPKEVIQSFARGELPNPQNLPEDLKSHLAANFEKLMVKFSKVRDINDYFQDEDYEKVIEKLPRFERIEVTTFIPYDINYGERSGIIGKSSISIISAAVVIVLCVQRGKKLVSSSKDGSEGGAYQRRFVSLPRRDTGKSSAVHLLSGSKGSIPSK